MMQWERKKPYSSSFGYQIGHVFPRSWISRFKKMSGRSTKSSPDNYTKRKENEDPVFPGFQPRTSWNEGRFHGENEEAYWRLSFGEEKFDGVQNVGVFKSLWYDSDDELNVRNLSPQCLRAKEQNHKFSDVIPGRRNVKKYCQNDGILQGNEACIEEQEIERFEVMRRRALQDIKSRKAQQREEKYGDLASALGNSTEYGKPVGWRKQRDRSNYRIFEDFAFENLKMEKKKSEEQRKSATICRESTRRRSKQRRKVRVYTPRTAARIECKIRALEDLKKAKTKMKKMMTKEKPSNGVTSFDSFAVLKTSTNPQEDFERSMVEMITAEGITQPQELEELLACYLTLNCDEYHDLIIKVFRQVWFELNKVRCKPLL